MRGADGGGRASSVTGSIAGFMPGTFQAVYNGPRRSSIRSPSPSVKELRNTGVTVTCLMPGATETRFLRTRPACSTHKIGQGRKDDPTEVAKAGYEAVMAGEGDVVSGWKNKLQSSLANVTLPRSSRNSTARRRSRVQSKADRLLGGFAGGLHAHDEVSGVGN